MKSAVAKLAPSHADQVTHNRRVAETVNNILGFQHDDSRIRTAAEVSAGVTPVNYAYGPGYVDRYGTNTTPGTTNMTAAIKAAIAQLSSGGSLSFLPGQVYAIDAQSVGGCLVSGKSNFKIFGNNATIKVLNGESVVGGNGMLYFDTSTDFYVENLVLDSNRANRTPNGSGAYNLQVSTSCARGFFQNIRAINAVEDGFTVNTSTPAVQASYPTDITFKDCIADNAYRNGLSIIGSIRCSVLGGSYSNTGGTSPQNGIDVEGDSSYVFGNSDLILEPDAVFNNAGVGICITGNNAAVNNGAIVSGTKFTNNTLAAVQVAQGTNIDLYDLQIVNHPGNASLGVVHIGDASGAVSNVRLRGINITGQTSSTPAAAVNVTGNVTGTTVLDNISCNSVACQAILAGGPVDARNIDIHTCTSTSPAIQSTGSKSVWRNIYTDTTTAAGFYCSGADTEVDGIAIVDYGASASAGIQWESGATGSILRNWTVMQRTSIPSSTYAVRYNGVVPRILRTGSAKSAGTDYTSTTVANFVSGVSGSTITDIVPDPFRITQSINPGTIAAGGQFSATYTITGIALGDPLFAAPGVALGTLTYSVQVESANTGRLTIANNTAGGVTPGTSTWVFWAEKRAA